MAKQFSPSLGHHGVFLLEIFCLPLERITASRLFKCGSSPKVYTIGTGLSAARALISTTTMPTLKHRALQLVAWRVHYCRFIAARRSQLNWYTQHRKGEHRKGPLETASLGRYAHHRIEHQPTVIFNIPVGEVAEQKG
jgi:chorismate mutase